MAEPAGRTMIVVDGRVLEMPSYRSASTARLEGSVAWWGSLALLGGSLLVLGAFVGADLGSATAIGGVVLFLVAAILAGAERYELATALGVSAVLWTSAGIAVYLGTDPSLIGSLLAFAIVGVVALVAGGLGALRKRSRDLRPVGPSP
ncbi:MAG TPA: hypothetical protein VGG32_03470 [Thermoplasmata archaeon]